MHGLLGRRSRGTHGARAAGSTTTATTATTGIPTATTMTTGACGCMGRCPVGVHKHHASAMGGKWHVALPLSVHLHRSWTAHAPAVVRRTSCERLSSRVRHVRHGNNWQGRRLALALMFASGVLVGACAFDFVFVFVFVSQEWVAW